VEFGETSLEGTWVGGNTTLLMLVATTASLIGIVIAWLVYERGRIKANEPTILANAWYYDRTVSDFMGGPGRQSFEGAAWFDQHVVDGAVNGAGEVVRVTAGELRKGQSGFVRGYAAIIGIGVVGLLAWFVLVRGIL
jgi:NADH-quinone oxidoreductase subunit L